MAHYLPPTVMSYFQPKPLDLYTPIVTSTTTQYEIEQLKKYKHEQNVQNTAVNNTTQTTVRLLCGYTGVSNYLRHYKNYDTYIQQHTVNKPTTVQLTNEQRKLKKHEKRKKRNTYALKPYITKYKQQITDTTQQTQWTVEAYKTLFVGRLHYNITVEQLKYEMKYYGKVVQIIIPRHKQTPLTLLPFTHTNGTEQNTDMKSIDTINDKSNGTIHNTNNHTNIKNTFSKRQQRKQDRIKRKQQQLNERIKLLKKDKTKHLQIKKLQLRLSQLQPTVKPTPPICGYAFIEFEHSSDLTAAYKDLDGRNVLNKRVVVDVERGRTVKDWLPRRLGGGLGYTRKGKPEESQYYPGREHNTKYKDDNRFVPMKPVKSQAVKQKELRDVRTVDIRSNTMHGSSDRPVQRYDDRSRGDIRTGDVRHHHTSGEKRYREYDSREDTRYDKRR